MLDYIITLSLKTRLLIILEDGLQKGGNGNLVGEENGLSGKNDSRGFYGKYITCVITSR